MDIQNAPKNNFSLVLTLGGDALFSLVLVQLITEHLGSESYDSIVAIIAASRVIFGWTSIAMMGFGVDEFIKPGKFVREF